MCGMYADRPRRIALEENAKKMPGWDTGKQVDSIPSVGAELCEADSSPCPPATAPLKAGEEKVSFASLPENHTDADPVTGRTKPDVRGPSTNPKNYGNLSKGKPNSCGVDAPTKRPPPFMR